MIKAGKMHPQPVLKVAHLAAGGLAFTCTLALEGKLNGLLNSIRYHQNVTEFHRPLDPLKKEADSGVDERDKLVNCSCLPSSGGAR